MVSCKAPDALSVQLVLPKTREFARDAERGTIKIRTPDGKLWESETSFYSYTGADITLIPLRRDGVRDLVVSLGEGGKTSSLYFDGVYGWKAAVVIPPFNEDLNEIEILENTCRLEAARKIR